MFVNAFKVTMAIALGIGVSIGILAIFGYALAALLEWLERMDA